MFLAPRSDIATVVDIKAGSKLRVERERLVGQDMHGNEDQLASRHFSVKIPVHKGVIGGSAVERLAVVPMVPQKLKVTGRLCSYYYWTN
jgi:hypothetical protein